MQWNNFVFSNQPRHRNRRHLVCWLLWWIYIVFTIFFTRDIASLGFGSFYQYQPGLNELGYLQYSLLVCIKSFLLLLTHLLFCYAIIYFLLPNFQSKKKYWPMITGVLLLSTLIILVGYFLYSIVYPFIDNQFSLHSTEQNKAIVWAGIDAGLINAIKVTMIAAAITLLKQWWLNQKEKEKIEREKINAELQLLKAQIHPAFLFSTLNNIISHARVASPKAPEMLIKLSDLLSYMLYECDAPKVKLEKEISMIKEYMLLEKIRQGERLEMTIRINGNFNRWMISPLILFPFIDNSLSYFNQERLEQAWINLDITIHDNNFSMKLINGIPAPIPGEPGKDEHSLVNVRKRLHLLYPGSHDLKINAEQELLMVHLNLKLEETTQEDQAAVDTTKTILSHAGI